MKHDLKIVFIITSVIYPADKPLNYSAVRSYFTPDERVDQTILTIESIRSRFNNAYIVLLEMGISERNIPLELKSIVDRFIFLGDKRVVRFACDSKYKGFGESVGLLAASSAISGLGDYFFKISGRYFLTDNFDIELWELNKFGVRKYGKDISTRLYGFPEEKFVYWKKALWRSLPKLLMGKQIESTLPQYLPEGCMYTINKLGVAGYVAPNGVYIEE